VRSLYAQRPDVYMVKELCGLLGVTKQAYYKHDPYVELRRMAKEEFALQYIRAMKAKDPGIGGMKLWLMYGREFGEMNRIGRDRFCDIIDRHGYKVRRRCRRPRTTDSRHNNPLYPNLVKSLIPTRVGEQIVGDITYIPLDSSGQKFCYVSLIMDSYSKFVLGASVGMTLEAKYPLEALSQAIETLEGYGVDLSQTIHHTDRGVQYTCAEYIRALNSKSISISMTEGGNPKDNSEAERLNNTLKHELFHGLRFSSITQVREALDKAIKFYNYERPHLSLNRLTPAQACRMTGRFKRDWVSYRERAIDKTNQEVQERDESDV